VGERFGSWGGVDGTVTGVEEEEEEERGEGEEPETDDFDFEDNTFVGFVEVDE